MSDLPLIFALEELEDIPYNNNLISRLLSRDFLDLKKVAFQNPNIYFSSPVELKKRRKQLVKKYYEPKIEAAAIGGAIGATISGMGAKSIKRLNKVKVPAAVFGGAIGAMLAGQQRQRSIIRELKTVDQRLGETKATNIKKMRV